MTTEDPGPEARRGSASEAWDELDEALERFQRGGLEYAGGLANHGPMAAEALVALGHRALVPAFGERYAPRLGVPLEPGRELREPERAAALGRWECASDWLATQLAGLGALGWRGLLERELPALLPGLFAGATHGWLRVAHALRALAAGESAVRARELAFGLAYWAARFQVLPGEPGAASTAGVGPEQVEDWVAALAPLPAERRDFGLFTDAGPALAGHGAYLEAVAALDPEALAARSGEALSALCRGVARRYLATPGSRIALVHGITAPSALRLVGEALPRPLRREAVARAFQAAAAMVAVAGPPEPLEDRDGEVRSLAADPPALRYRAACSMEEHAIKMAEACLREDAVAPSPWLRRAAADAALRIEPTGSGAC